MWKLLGFLFLLACSDTAVEEVDTDKDDPVVYYSDYFVFLADDGGSPLVVPVDFNWSPTEKGYEIEYKCWYGTAEDWPIHYLKREIRAAPSAIPGEAFAHQDTEVFDFDQAGQSVVIKMEGAPEMTIRIPDKKEWVLPDKESEFPTYAFRTSILIDGAERSGWMLYEKIRATPGLQFAGFAAFYWMPVIIDGSLFHFTDHKGEQGAVRWQNTEEGVRADVLPAFDFEVVATEPDSLSGRAAVAQTVRLRAAAWDVDITLNSTGNQTGRGEQHPKGLALFRQSLLQAAPESADAGFGMMELILADN